MGCSRLGLWSGAGTVMVVPAEGTGVMCRLAPEAGAPPNVGAV